MAVSAGKKGLCVGLIISSDQRGVLEVLQEKDFCDSQFCETVGPRIGF